MSSEGGASKAQRAADVGNKSHRLLELHSNRIDCNENDIEVLLAQSWLSCKMQCQDDKTSVVQEGTRAHIYVENRWNLNDQTDGRILIKRVRFMEDSCTLVDAVHFIANVTPDCLSRLLVATFFSR